MLFNRLSDVHLASLHTQSLPAAWRCVIHRTTYLLVTSGTCHSSIRYTPAVEQRFITRT